MYGFYNKYRIVVQPYEVSIYIGQRLRCLGNMISVFFLLFVDECQSLTADIWQSLKIDIRHLDLHINYIYIIQLLFFTGRNFVSCAEKKIPGCNLPIKDYNVSNKYNTKSKKIEFI
jgi:hypothetical protein